MDITPLHHQMGNKLRELLTNENIGKEIKLVGRDDSGISRDNFTFLFIPTDEGEYYVVRECSLNIETEDYMEYGYSSADAFYFSKPGYKTLIDKNNFQIIVDDVIDPNYYCDDVINFSSALYSIYFLDSWNNKYYYLYLEERLYIFMMLCIKKGWDHYSDIIIHIADMFRHIYFFRSNYSFRDGYKNHYA